MPFYQKGDVRIRYEETGSGFPLLVTPGGGLNSRVANWPTAEILRFRGEGRTDTNAGPELLVCALESRCHVDGVTISRVIEESATTKIADDRWSSMYTDPCQPQRDVFLVPALAR